MKPSKFTDLIGQSRVLGLVQAECKRVPRHTLMYGPPGLGKTTVARIMAKESGMGYLELSAGKMLTPSQITRKLLDLPTEHYSHGGLPMQGAVKFLCFVDECHKLADFVQWHTILTDRAINPDPWQGTSWLPVFTVVMATNYPNLLPEPLKSRFPVLLRFEPYNDEKLVLIVSRAYPRLKAGQVSEIVGRSRGSARMALAFADTVALHGCQAFDALEIDALGLTPMDRRYLHAMAQAGRPLSLNSVSAMIQENPAVVRGEIEPYLLRLGLIFISAKGRELVATVNENRSRGTVEFIEA